MKKKRKKENETTTKKREKKKTAVPLSACPHLVRILFHKAEIPIIFLFCVSPWTFCTLLKIKIKLFCNSYFFVASNNENFKKRSEKKTLLRITWTMYSIRYRLTIWAPHAHQRSPLLRPPLPSPSKVFPPPFLLSLVAGPPPLHCIVLL